MTVYSAFKDYLVEYGILVNRFEHLLWIWEKYVIEFFDKDLFVGIKEAKDTTDRESLRSAVHKMKGEALNLGFDSLAAICDNILNTMKVNPNNTDSIEKSYLEIKEIYYDMREIYNKNFREEVKREE